MLNNQAALYGGGEPPAVGDFESIASVTVGSGGSSSISFTSIPQTYQHLQIRAFSKLTSGANQQTAINFNGDTTSSNYRFHEIYGDGSAANPYGLQDQSILYASSSQFNAGVVDILDYTNTNKNTVSRSLFGFDTNGAGYVIIRSSLWLNTAAITSFTLTSPTAFAQYSHFALYGIKG